MSKFTRWQYLRIKADETADDSFDAGTNTAPGASISASFPAQDGHDGIPYTGIECVVIGIDANGDPIARSTMTVDLQFVEQFTARIDDASHPRDGEDVSRVVDCSSASTTAVPLNRKVYFELNGAERFSVRVTNDANEAVDAFEVWWRAVAR